MNLANQLTIARVVLIPVFMIFLLVDFGLGEFVIGGVSITYAQLIATFIFIVAATTDGLDGYIARSRKLVTNFGKFLDPLADKLLITAALVSLVELGSVPAWMVVVILSREFAVTGLRLVAAGEGTVIAASSFAKLKTATQIVAIVAVMLNNIPFVLIGIPFDMIMMWVAVVITILSGIDYFAKNYNVIRQE